MVEITPRDVCTNILPMIEHRCRIEHRVPFFDIDSMHMAWHGHYAKYFELARCRLLEEIGHDYNDMFASGFAWPVVDLRVRYMRSLRFNQTIQITALLKRWDQRLHVAYRVRDAETGTHLARGRTVQAPVDLETGERYAGTPEAVRQALARFESKGDAL